jgi:hypothetical protein
MISNGPDGHVPQVTAEPVKSEETGAFKAEDGKYVDVADLLKVCTIGARMGGLLRIRQR